MDDLEALANYANKMSKMGDLYHFNNKVLGYDKMAEQPHRLMCDSIQYGGSRQLHLWPRGHFKAVDVNYPVWTPEGFKKHGELDIGDYVFGGDGDPTKVIAKTPIFYDADCYEVSFSDKTSVTVSGDHLWTTNLSSQKRVGEGREGWTTKTINTRELLDEVEKSKKYKSRPYPTLDSVKICDGNYLGFDPYLVGVWLGDGTKGTNQITTSEEDVAEMERNISGCGVAYKTYRNADKIKISIDPGKTFKKGSSGFCNLLRSLGIMKSKHIPKELMLSSHNDRFDLLQGLMDTDGTCHHKHGQCSYCSADEILAKDVYVLCGTLGLNPTFGKHSGLYKGERRTFYQVRFNGSRLEPVFRLKRKLKNLSRLQYQRRKRIIDVFPVSSIPVSCIQVENPNGVYLIGPSFIPTHNSTMITIGYSLYSLALDPNLRIFIGNSVLSNAKSFLREIKGHLKDNENLREIMGDTVNKDDKWTEQEIILKTRTVNKKEPSIQVAGVGQSLVSQHYDLMFLDDLVDQDNINTPELIQKTIDWYRMAISLLEPDGKIILIGTRYHYADLYGWLIENHSDKFSPQIHACWDEKGKPIFPSRFTKEILEGIKSEQGSTIFSGQYLNDPVDAENAKFKRTDFQYFTDETIQGKELYTIYMIDRAYSLAKTADFTAHVVVSIDRDNNWYVRLARRAKESETDLIKRIFDTKRAFNVDKVGVEQKAFKDTLEVTIREEMNRQGDYFQIEELKGRMSKISRIEGLVPRFENHKIFFRKGMEDLEDELIRFPLSKHDDLMDSLAYGNDLAQKPINKGKKKTPIYHPRTGRVIRYA